MLIMKLKELREIMDIYNPEVEFRFVVMQDDVGEGGENTTIALLAEDYFTYRFNKRTKELEIIIDL
jgi:hypothetical protein